MTGDHKRHLSPESFATYLTSAAPIDHPIPGEPRIVLFFDPVGTRIGLRTPAPHTDKPPPTGLAHVTLHAVHHHGQRMIELAVTDARLFTDAYPLLQTVADRIQLDGQEPAAAVEDTLRTLGHLLRPEDTLATATEAGLLGELCLLDRLTGVLTPTAALEAWRGWQHEEHDFGLPDIDVEVKTTTSEERTHLVTATQLVPTGDRPLWLLSLQITRAGSGGTTLPNLIARVRHRLPDTASRRRLDSQLAAAGWRERFTELCRQPWRLRTGPAIFAVNGTFPRLTPTQLERAGVDTARVIDIRYRLRLTGLAPDTPPPHLVAAITTDPELL